jgi:ferredoxin
LPVVCCNKQQAKNNKQIGTECRTVPKLRFNDHEVPLTPGATLFEHADQTRVRIAHTCKRRGACHECIVQVLRGAEALSAPSQDERFLRQGFRLACQARVERGDTEIHVHALRRGALQIATGGKTGGGGLDPCVTRGEGGKVRIDGEEVWRSEGPLYGIAADIGTTTVVVRLVDLESGEVRATHGFENPQVFGGLDVMGRISYDAQDGRRILNSRYLTRRLPIRGIPNLIPIPARKGVKQSRSSI